ncbi:MAG: hypothetical protein H2066_07260 [Candidatus Poseidoniales archaeon]|nr:hypothetical protein [Candidatus Poseidoniales archaeon]
MAGGRYVVDSSPKRGSDFHRWDWFAEFTEIPLTDNYEQFKEQFDRNIKDIIPLFIQWNVLGWDPIVKRTGNWDYAATFNHNHGTINLFSEFGKKVTHLVKLFKVLHNLDNNYSTVKEETLNSIRDIRYNILRFRWKKYSEILLNNTDIDLYNINEELESILHLQTIRRDVFRILCLDYLSRNQALSWDEIVVIWNVFDKEEHDLISFREKVDSICNSSEIIYQKDPLKWKYIFYEFEDYNSTFEVRLIPSIGGKFAEGYTKLDGLENILHYIMES